MATVSNLALNVVTNVANVDVKVDYDITWTNFDKSSNQPYSESVRLIGDDTALVPAEDGVDDFVPGGVLSPPFFFPVILQSNGAATLHRSFSRTLPLANLNEDVLATPNPDEIRAKVVLTPTAPTVATAESNLVTLNVN